MTETAGLDRVDIALLEAVQQDARTSQDDLGARVGLSAAAVSRRLRRLTELGYLSRTVTVLDADRLGHPLTVIVQLEALSEEIDRLDELQQRLVTCPNVQQCYYVTGEWDYVVVLLVRDMDQYRELTRDLFFSGNVKRFKTLVAMDRAKVTLDVPITDT